MLTCTNSACVRNYPANNCSRITVEEITVCSFITAARNPEDGNISSSSEPMNGGRRGSRRLSRQDIRTRNEEDQKSTEDRLRRFNDTYPLDSHTRGNTGADAASAPPETAAAVDEARDAISRRLTLPHISADEVGATPRVPALLPPLNESDKPRSSDPAVDGATVDPAKLEKQKRDTGRTHQDGAGGAHKDGAAASQEFDGARYNPDGQVRTMHTLPNLEKSLKEAKKTRYVRHKKKQWFETELSINEVFHNIRPQT